MYIKEKLSVRLWMTQDASEYLNLAQKEYVKPRSGVLKLCESLINECLYICIGVNTVHKTRVNTNS